VIHDEFVNQKMSPDLATTINKRIKEIINGFDVNQNLDLVVTTSKLQLHPNNLFSYLFLNDIIYDGLKSNSEIVYDGKKYVFIDCNKYFYHAVQGYLRSVDFKSFNLNMRRLIRYDINYDYKQDEYILQIPALQLWASGRCEKLAKQELIMDVVKLYKELGKHENIGTQPFLWKIFLSNCFHPKTQPIISSSSKVNRRRLKKMFNYFRNKNIRITDSRQKILCNYHSFKLQKEGDGEFTVLLYEDNQTFQFNFDVDMEFVDVGEIKDLEYFFNIEIVR